MYFSNILTWDEFDLFIKPLDYMDMVLGKSLIDLMQRPKTHIFLAGPWGSVFVGWRNTEMHNPKESPDVHGFQILRFCSLQNLHQIMDDNWPK